RCRSLNRATRVKTRRLWSCDRGPAGRRSPERIRETSATVPLLVRRLPEGPSFGERALCYLDQVFLWSSMRPTLPIICPVHCQREELSREIVRFAEESHRE